MKLNHKGYAIPLNNPLVKKIQQELTFTEAETTYNENRPKITIKCFWTSSNNIYVPRLYGINKFGMLDFDYPNAKKIPEDRSQFKGTLRDYQINIVDNIFKNVIPQQRGGFIHMGAGTGKTITLLNIVAKLRSKTIIVVHTNLLMKQWRERIAHFLPNATIGIIQGPHFEIDNDIVIAMLQTLSRKYNRYNWRTFESFECMAVDEAHHIPSQKFSLILHKLQCKYRFALSATPRRDNFQDIITHHIGPTIAQYSIDLYVPEILIYNSYETFPIPKKYDGKVNYSKFLNILSYHPERNERIASIITDIQEQYNHSRKMIVFVHRKLQAHQLNELISKKCPNVTSSTLIGSHNDVERTEAIKSDIIVATYGIAKEGVDISKLDCVVIAAPIGGHKNNVSKNMSYGDIEQVVGRVLRKENINKPLVIDINDSRLYPTRNQYNQRITFYREKNYKLTNNGSPNEPLNKFMIVT